jgi:hypothetical protein
MSKIDAKKLAEMHRKQLKEALTELLERADEIVDTAYNNNTTNVDIYIEIAPCELVTYSINYKCVAKSKETFNESEESGK